MITARRSTRPSVVTGRLCLPVLRLAGGDGQEVDAPGRCVPQPVRVVLDSGCGPVPGARITASAKGAAGSPGLVLAAEPGEPVPATLRGHDASATAVAVAGPDGAAEFWWQPGVDPNVPSATLEVSLAVLPVAPLRVTAQLDPAGGPDGRAPPGCT